MHEFILIIASFLLGFWQGLKKRNKKNKIIIKEYETEISKLNNKITTMERKLRLQQYDNGSLKKKNKDRFETDLTSYITLSSNNYYLCANIYGLLNMIFSINNKKNANYMNQKFDLEQIKIEIQNYFEEAELTSTNVDLIIEYQKGVKKLVDPYTVYESYKKWINEFNVDIYDITLKEFIETLHFILYELNLSNKD